MRNLVTILLLSLTISSYAQKTTSSIKPYNHVITTEAITKKGFVSTHQLKNKLYLEIPSTMLNKEMLFVAHGTYGGSKDSKQIKWIKKHHKIHVIIPEVESKVGNTIPLINDNLAIKKIIPATFPILAVGHKGSSYVIEVTDLFLKTPKELPDGGKAIIDDLTYINKVLAFDTTIEVKTTKTITSDKGPRSADADFSLFLLPEPMVPRLYDHRMGFAKEKHYRNINNKGRAAIQRWRLEKKDKDQKLSDPINPITLYFDPATPAKWKPYIKAGIEEWLPAFEAAGFKNAIVVKDTPVDDKNWSLNSMRYSYIIWRNNSKYRGHEGEGVVGSGTTVIDQRTGEILNAHINIGNINFLVDLYFTRCSPLDPRAQQLPFPDDLMGELIQYITAHETGHIFGLIDGHYGEYTYPFEKMRDKKWLEEMGHTPSVMSYTRQNFIVQPEDKIPPSLLQQKVGPTDLYSIRWGYTPFKDAKTPDEERPYLEKIIREQEAVPWYTYSENYSEVLGPGDTKEVVESDNPVKATALGIKNLKRVIALIPHATRNEPGSELKRHLHHETMDLWGAQMKLVVSLVGGHTIQYKYGSQQGAVAVPIPANRQKEAVAFLNKEAFHPPLWMVPPKLIRSYLRDPKDRRFQIKVNSSLEIVSNRQLKILTLLFYNIRKLEETSLTTKNAYTVEAFFQDLNAGLWSELKCKDIKINPYRQILQIAYIQKLKVLIAFERSAESNRMYKAFRKHTYSNYIRSVALNALKTLKDRVKKGMRNTDDKVTKAHLELCLSEINKE